MMKKAFPVHGYIGIIVLILSEILHLNKVEPFYSWFYCFAWWSYILIIDGMIYWLKGNSLLFSRTKEFFLMIPWSTFIWSIFELANLSLKNWYYVNIPNTTIERWCGYAVAYGTVLPGIFETTEFLETVGLFRAVQTKPLAINSKVLVGLIILGILCLLSSLLIPYYCFSLIWVGLIFLLDPINYRAGGRSLLADLESGKPRKIYLLLVGGLICGFLWEFWNFWARSKWVYTVPFFEDLKGFEMPYLGFLGFPPFAVQCYVMYNFISLFRFQRGWEESTYQVNRERKTRLTTAILTVVLIASFWALVFRWIDLRTVNSYYVRLSDAYWIAPNDRAELPKVGIASLDDLISKTRTKKERDELSLRLLIPKEKLNRWIEEAELVQLKAMGIENLRFIEALGIHSVSALAAEDPDKLYERMKQICKGEAIPGKAKLRIWIREARKHVRG